MPLDRQSDGTCVCGKPRPENASYKGWRRGLCGWCYQKEMRAAGREWALKTSTEKVRKYRSDPEKAERDREASRRWKRENRERNQARDRAYQRARKAA